MAAVVDDRMQGGQANAAGNEQQVLPGEIRVYREAVAIGATNRYLLARPDPL